MESLELYGGYPKEPDDLDEVASFPGPTTFLNALFTQLLGHPPGPARVEHEKEVPGEERTSYGRCGGATEGYWFTEWRCLETSAFPMRCTWETYGLPGIELRWEFSLEKVNVAGYCGFRNGSLRVRFAGSAARQTFERIWTQLFSTPPVFRPAP